MEWPIIRHKSLETFPQFQKIAIKILPSLTQCWVSVIINGFLVKVIIFVSPPSTVHASTFKKRHFDENPANPKFDLYYSKRKIGIQLADCPKFTPFTRKTPEIRLVEDAQNARPPCWPWIRSSGQRFHAVTSSYQHDAASHSFLISRARATFRRVFCQNLHFFRSTIRWVMWRTCLECWREHYSVQRRLLGLLRTAHIEQVPAIKKQETSEFMMSFSRQVDETLVISFKILEIGHEPQLSNRTALVALKCFIKQFFLSQFNRATAWGIL